MGYHIYPPELKALKEAVKSAASHSYSCAPAPMQHAVAKGLSNMEECERYISHTSRIMSHISLFVHRLVIECSKLLKYLDCAVLTIALPANTKHLYDISAMLD